MWGPTKTSRRSPPSSLRIGTESLTTPEVKNPDVDEKFTALILTDRCRHCGSHGVPRPVNTPHKVYVVGLRTISERRPAVSLPTRNRFSTKLLSHYHSLSVNATARAVGADCRCRGSCGAVQVETSSTRVEAGKCLVSALQTSNFKYEAIAFKLCLQFQLAPPHLGAQRVRHAQAAMGGRGGGEERCGVGAPNSKCNLAARGAPRDLPRPTWCPCPPLRPRSTFNTSGRQILARGADERRAP